LRRKEERNVKGEAGTQGRSLQTGGKVEQGTRGEKKGVV